MTQEAPFYGILYSIMTSLCKGLNLMVSLVSFSLCIFNFSWQNDVFVVAEPGELAEKFLQSVKYSLLSMMKGRKRNYTSVITNISTVADLVTCRPYFQIGGVVHRYIGRQTQVSVPLFLCTEEKY